MFTLKFFTVVWFVYVCWFWFWTNNRKKRVLNHYQCWCYLPYGGLCLDGWDMSKISLAALANSVPLPKVFIYVLSICRFVAANNSEVVDCTHGLNVIWKVERIQLGLQYSINISGVTTDAVESIKIEQVFAAYKGRVTYKGNIFYYPICIFL